MSDYKKKTEKKLLAAALSIFMCISFFGCSRKAAEDNAKENDTALSTQETTEYDGSEEESLPRANPTPVTSAQSEFNSSRAPLPLQEFTVNDPENTRGLSNEKVCHSYGIAKDGKANSISVNFEKTFEEKGWNAVCLDTKSQEKALYLTFDCGYENGYTSKILDTLKEKGVTAAFFCTLPQVKQNPELISRMIDEGHIVGNHSNTHPSFPEISRTQMKDEIQAMDDYLRLNFGYSAPFFRYPKGEYSENSMDLVNSLGYKCVFWSCSYADWDLDNQKGSDYAFNTVTSRLHPGAVILLHAVSPDNSAALGRIIDYAKEQGYVFKSLNDL